VAGHGITGETPAGVVSNAAQTDIPPQRRTLIVSKLRRTPEFAGWHEPGACESLYQNGEDQDQNRGDGTPGTVCRVWILRSESSYRGHGSPSLLC